MKTPQSPGLPGCTPLGFRRPDASGAGSLGLANPLSRDQAALAQRKANAPLKPSVAQAPCDVGLFSDDAAQSDLVDQRGR